MGHRISQREHPGPVRQANLYGRRRIFAIGVAGFGAASLACAVAPSVEVLIGGRALQGAFGALLVPSSLAIITTIHPPGERAAAIGSWTAGTSAAIAVGPPLGGLLVDAISWRVIFAMNLPLVLVCLWLIARAVPECPGDREHRIDIPGAVLCVLGLAGPTYALIQQPQLGFSDARVWLPLIGGIGALGAFVAYEQRAPDPMLPPSIFRSRNFAVGNVVTLTAYGGLGAGSFFIAIFLQQIAGYSALQAGLALLPITLLLIGLSRRFGALAARVGPRLLMSAGPFVGGLGLLAFTRVDARGSYVADVLPATLLFGLGLAMTVAPLTATVLQAAERRHAGIASGVNNAIAGSRRCWRSRPSAPSCQRSSAAPSTGRSRATAWWAPPLARTSTRPAGGRWRCPPDGSAGRRAPPCARRTSRRFTAG